MRFAVVTAFITISSAGLCAQSSAGAEEPPLRRWFDLQTFTVSSRYRFIANSAEVTTSDQLQYKPAIKAQFNLDARKRYTIHAGYFSGSSFISSWNNWGPGTGSFDGKDHYVKQLYAAAAPVPGVDLQFGGLYVVRGENDDLTTYDEDGYIVGERITIRRPKSLYFDEISVTHGSIGPFNQPSLAKRWGGIRHPDYTQVLVGKGLARGLAGSLGYTRHAGSETLRAAVTLRLAAKSPVHMIRYEQYRRVNNHPASGFALSADRMLPRRARLQAGFATVDQFYGGWNADRIQSGRHFFALLAVPIAGPLTAQLFGTEALPSGYPITNQKRYEAVIACDILSLLKRTNVF